MQVTPVPRRHLASSELGGWTRTCPICRSEAPRRAVARLQSDPDVEMLACARCRACSASRMPAAEVLEAYYATYYAGLERGVTFSDTVRFARHLVRLFPDRTFGRSIRILDYGGGDGSLSRSVAERLIGTGRTAHAAITVVDFATRQAEWSDTIDIRFQTPAQPIDEAFDLVLASAILEHVPDLHPLLGRLYAAIAAGGLFYARTPYAVPLARLMPRLDLAFPAHVHDMGWPFWRRFPDWSGWSVHSIVSRPSPVAASLREDPLRALAAMAMKWPARIARCWPFAGGWEVLLRRV